MQSKNLKKKYDPDKFRVNDKEIPSIDENGFLQFEWPKQIENIDYLFATPVEINISEYPSGRKIAEKINSKEYPDYFIENYNCGIITYADSVVKEYLKKEYRGRLD